MRRSIRLFVVRTAILALAASTACHRADSTRPLIVVLIPSQDNPFFKAEGDAAAARAMALGYRVRVDAHDDDAYHQDLSLIHI